MNRFFMTFIPQIQHVTSLCKLVLTICQEVLNTIIIYKQFQQVKGLPHMQVKLTDFNNQVTSVLQRYLFSDLISDT